ncbi:DoxX family protein [Fulvivirga sediminis]|uniref:DoxX family membrane protein n=1 Tax=Fulvivirga sediminis TaxID=2803949 RepID=A0A937FCL1_9BACT|nr:hypothetical protein [Fulvivirga sediminis]MBL3658724.1 hypothetical protein [Fulvivirga sediminis]
MKPLIVLIITFCIAILINKIVNGNYNLALSGRIAMAVMLAFTAIAHFAYTTGMSMMIPSFIPFKTELVYLTGIIEIVAAIGLLLPHYRIITGWLLILFFILILPANIYAAMYHVDFQQASLNGKGLTYLWFRVPLQIIFIVWTYLSAVKTSLVETHLSF